MNRFIIAALTALFPLTAMAADQNTPNAFRFVKNNSAGDGTVTFFAEDTGAPTLLLWTGSTMEAITTETGITYTTGSWDGSTWVPGQFKVGVTPEIDTAMDDLWANVINPTLTGYATASSMTTALSSKADASALSSYATTSALTSGLASKADTSALSSYATTSALTSGLAAKQGTITLTTTGSGAASLVGTTLNIPTPSAAFITSVTAPLATSSGVLSIGSATASAAGSMSAADKAKLDTIAEEQRTITTVGSNGRVTWTYPVAYGSGVVPVIQANCVKPTSSTAAYNVQIYGDPTNTSVTIEVTQVPQNGTIGVLGSLLSLVSPAPSGTKVHIVAKAP